MNDTYAKLKLLCPDWSSGALRRAAEKLDALTDNINESNEEAQRIIDAYNADIQERNNRRNQRKRARKRLK